MSRRRLGLLLVPPAVAALVVALGGARQAGETAVVAREDLPIVADVTGTLQAIKTMQLGPPEVPGIWEFKLAFIAPEGAEVKEGQKILAFDTSDLERMLMEKQAERDEAAKQLEKREAELQLRHQEESLALSVALADGRKADMKLDVPSELQAGAERERARLDRDIAGERASRARERLEVLAAAAREELTAIRSKRELAEGRVAELEKAIEAMEVKSPRAGTVIYTQSRRGEKKKVGDPCWKAERVVELPDLTAMEAMGEVDEVDMGRVAEDQPVRLRLDAHPDVEYRAKLAYRWRTVQQRGPDDPVRIVRVKIVLDATDRERMRPGMRFKGEVETERVRGALVLPASAVLATAEGPVAWRRTLRGFERVKVVAGRRGRDRVQVLEGLAEGDVVLLHPEERES